MSFLPMCMVQAFTDLGVWQKAMELAVKVQGVTKGFPKDEIFGVVSQMRRAAVSVSANIAEGFGRYTYADKMHKYVQARGELVELMNFVHYCNRVGYLSQRQPDLLLADATDVYKMLNALIASMKDRVEN